jgi:5-methylcytosine-specific restriction endonuclease McrA
MLIGGMQKMSKIYPIDLVFTILGKENLETQCYNKSNKSKENQITVDGRSVYTRSLRYMTFYQKGCKCCVCGKEGTHFTLDPSADNPDRSHFNLRADDGTLMTRDHIIPKSKGGREHISNMQTMCVDCNKAKGNHMEGEEPPKMTIVAIESTNSEKRMEFVDENDAIFYVLNNIMKVTQAPTKKNRMGNKIKKSIEVTRQFLVCLNSGMPYCGKYWYTIGEEPPMTDSSNDNKTISSWDELVGMKNSTFWLDINPEIGFGWVRRVDNNDTVCYLSTHTFYEKKVDFSNDLLRSYGFNVTLTSWG